MKIRSNPQIWKFLFTIMLVGMIIIFGFGAGGLPAAHAHDCRHSDSYSKDETSNWAPAGYDLSTRSRQINGSDFWVVFWLY